MQYALIFQLFNHNHPKMEYTTMETLFVQLNFPNDPIKHWSNGYGWETANCMFEQVLKQIQIIIVGASFLSLSAYEVTTINN